MSEPLLTFQHITICAGNKPLATDISFTLQEGEILVIAGESGSGKSTLLRAAAGLPAPGTGITGGIITWDGHRLHHQSSDTPPYRNQCRIPDALTHSARSQHGIPAAHRMPPALPGSVIRNLTASCPVVPPFYPCRQTVFLLIRRNYPVV